jgi:hypothetical protein
MIARGRAPSGRWSATLAYGCRRLFVGTLAGGLVVVLLASTADGAPSAQTRAELAQAKKSLLVLSDMPKTWTASKSSSNSSPTPDAAELASCLGVPLKVVNDTPPTVSSNAFNSKEDLESVQDSIEVFPTAKAAQADLAVAGSPKAPKCFTEAFNSNEARSQLASAFGGNAAIGKLDVTRTPTSDYGPGTVNITIYFPVTTNGVAINLEFAEVGFVKGNEEQQMILTSVQQPFSKSLSRRLTTLAAGRL